MAEAMVNAVRRIDLSWVRVEIGLLIGALMMGGLKLRRIGQLQAVRLTLRVLTPIWPSRS